MSEPTIESVSHETRVFPPTAEFAARAHVKSRAEYEKLYTESIQDPEAFFAKQAAEQLTWIEPPKQTLEWKPPFAKWFVGGKLNLSANCLDRHLTTATRNKAALIWEGEPGDQRVLTYYQLHREVCRAANALEKLGVAKGDRVGIYMGMVP